MACLMFGCGHPRIPSNSDSGGQGRGPKCKICKRAGTMRWLAKHPNYGRNEQRKVKQRRVKPLMKLQKRRCAICRRLMKHPYEDHDHACCKNGCSKCRRGLLCPSCNGGLHLVEDNKLLGAAIAYLKSWAKWTKNY